jgi:hypothetical protein
MNTAAQIALQSTPSYRRVGRISATIGALLAQTDLTPVPRSQTHAAPGVFQHCYWNADGAAVRLELDAVRGEARIYFHQLGETPKAATLPRGLGAEQIAAALVGAT